MKSLYIFLVASLMVLSFSLAGFAENAMTGDHSSTQNPGAVNEQKMEPTVNVLTLTGKVVSVNKTDHTMLVKGQEDQWLFDVPDVATLDMVKPGQTVQVTYTKKNGRMVVSSVKSGVKMSMNEPAYGYDPYYGYDPHFYGYDPYKHG